jgi:hypothetical protein
MDTLLTSTSGLLARLWNWTLQLDGGLQIVLVLLACVASGACAIIGRRMQTPSPMDQGGTVAARTVLAVVCYIFGVICMLAMLFGLGAVFAPLVGLAN